MQLSDGIQPETEVIVPGIAIAFIPGNRFKLLGDRILNKIATTSVAVDMIACPIVKPLIIVLRWQT